MERKIKQVIVMRTKYPDGKGGVRGLRAGKAHAQAAHASMAWLAERVREALDRLPLKDPPHNVELLDVFDLTAWEMAWLKGKFTKVVVGVETEEELLEISEKAKQAELEVHVITDCGLTEFGGVPTITAVGIGPDYEDKIDPITGELKLL